MAASSWWRPADRLPAQGADGTPTLSVSKPAGSPVRVAWRARVEVAGGEFRVYRGPDAQHLRHVATLPADRGERGYRFRDHASSSADAVYEVRFAEPGGERVVARAFCARTSSLGRGVQTAVTWQPVAATAAATGELIAAAEPLYEAALSTPRSRPRPEPLDSPPRPLPV